MTRTIRKREATMAKRTEKETISKMELIRIFNLAYESKVNDWEREFISSIRGQMWRKGKLSQKQIKVAKRIHKTYIKINDIQTLTVSNF